MAAKKADPTKPKRTKAAAPKPAHAAAPKPAKAPAKNATKPAAAKRTKARRAAKQNGKDGAASAKGRSLVIVESPTKSRTLVKFLGRGYAVLASNGHIMDLPKSELGVDLENDFEPKYVP